jgi:hypothetical protein
MLKALGLHMLLSAVYLGLLALCLSLVWLGSPLGYPALGAWILLLIFASNKRDSWGV